MSLVIFFIICNKLVKLVKLAKFSHKTPIQVNKLYLFFFGKIKGVQILVGNKPIGFIAPI